MKKIFTLILSLFFIINITAYAEDKKEEQKLPDFIVVDNVKQTVENMAKKLKAEAKMPNREPQEYYDNTPILTWFFQDKEIGIAGDLENNFLMIVYHQRDSKSITTILQDDYKLAFDDELKAFLDTDNKDDNKKDDFESYYLKKLDNYFIVISKQYFDDLNPVFSLSVTTDEKFFEFAQREFKNNQ